jgi:hypothetical protein
MVQAREDLLAEIEGPNGTAVIYELTLPGASLIEVEYKVVFNGQETKFPSMGEAHLLANELVGLKADDEA